MESRPQYQIIDINPQVGAMRECSTGGYSFDQWWVKQWKKKEGRKVEKVKKEKDWIVEEERDRGASKKKGRDGKRKER